MTTVASFLKSPLLLPISLLGFSVGFPPFDDLATVSLPIHMLQHTLIALSGFMLGYSQFKRGALSTTQSTFAHLGSVSAVIMLLLFWHLPAPWDLAIIDPTVHAVEHLSFLLIGLIIGLFLVGVSDTAKIGILCLGLFGQLAFGLILVSNVQVYPFYSLPEQNSLGLVMLLVGPFYSTGLLLQVAKYRAWFNEVQPSSGDSLAEAGRVRTHRKEILSLLLSIVMITILAGYYIASIETVSVAASEPEKTVTVYIVETPISWQYSPRNIRVEVGVNNTVNWVSKSVSYDTVTSNDGLFNSGPIAPGHSYSYTFVDPGDYGYQCIYHPWMTGSVTVLP